MEHLTLANHRRYLSTSHTLANLKTYLLFAFSPLRQYYFRPNGKIGYLYSDMDRFYGAYIVQCYFPAENTCLLMSTDAASSFPVISAIITGSYQEKCIRTSIYHPNIKTRLNGPIIVILDTSMASIVLEDGETLQHKCMHAKGWSGV